jgi:hypothetical protein
LPSATPLLFPPAPTEVTVAVPPMAMLLPVAFAARAFVPMAMPTAVPLALGVAIAPTPIATLDPDTAFAPEPSAIEPAPKALELTPSATAFPPFALAVWPMAISPCCPALL